MATMAMALKFLDYGFAPSIVCKNSRLAIGELPAEESWLFSKYFSSKKFVFKELSWQTYGEISPEWGIDTQNFYWEHPGGDVSFRLHYKKEDFSVKGIACLGLSFNKSFMATALQSKWKAHDFIDSIGEGLMQNGYSSKVCPLIKKSFGVEFKKVIKSYRSSLLKRIVKKLLS